MMSHDNIVVVACCADGLTEFEMGHWTSGGEREFLQN